MENENKDDLQKEVASIAKSIVEQVKSELTAKAETEEKSQESTVAKVVSPFDAYGIERDSISDMAAKDFSGDKIKSLKPFQKDPELAKLKSLRFWQALVGSKLFPHEQNFHYTLKALSEGVDAAGGYLVNPEFRLEVLRQLHHNGIMRPEVNVIPVTTDSVVFNYEDGRPMVTWGAENTTISTTTARLGQTSISVYRMNTMMFLSREVVADSNPAIMDWIQAEFVDSVRNEEDEVIVRGSGSGRPTGITAVSGFRSYAATTLNFSALNNLVHTLPIQYRTKGNIKFFMNDLTVADVENLADTTGRPIYMRSVDGSAPALLLGYPVVVHNSFPEGTVYFGDLKRTYILLDRQQMSVETTQEGAGTFEKHQVGIKITERIGGGVVRKEALVKGTNFSA